MLWLRPDGRRLEPLAVILSKAGRADARQLIVSLDQMLALPIHLTAFSMIRSAFGSLNTG